MTYPLHAGAMLSPRPARRPKVSELLGLGEDVRLLNPKLLQTKGKTPRFYIRPQLERPTRDGGVERFQERVYLDATTRKEALKERTVKLEALNKRQLVLAAQITFGELLDEYLRCHVRRPGSLAATTAAKYESHIKNHIRPAFEAIPLGRMSVRGMQSWLDGKVKLSWACKTDLRNLLCGIFTKAEEWGYWRRDMKNPATYVTAGRRRAERPRQKMSVEDIHRLMGELPEDVRLICEVALYCTLRISEIMGVQEKHVSIEDGSIRIEQRNWRGNIDVPKTENSRRTVPLGHLTDRIKAKMTGNPENFVFHVKTLATRKLKSGEVQIRKGRECMDYCSIHRYFLRPAAKKLGIYYFGFGFHAFRAECITELSKDMTPLHIKRLAGHSNLAMTAHYTMADFKEHERAVRAMQERIAGKPITEVKQ